MTSLRKLLFVLVLAARGASLLGGGWTPASAHEGEGVLEVERERLDARVGDALFVPAGAEHRFVDYEHLSLLVVFARPRA